MPFVPVADTVEIVVTWSADCHNVFHLTGGVSAPTWPLTPADCADAIDEFANAFGDNLLLVLSADGTIDHFTARDISVADGDYAEASSGGVGGVVDDTAPLSTAACVSWRAGTGGRRGRGRTFLPFVPSSYCASDGKSLTGAGRTSLANAAAAFLVDAAWDKFAPAIASKLDGVSRVIASSSVDGELDSQMRRLHR